MHRTPLLFLTIVALAACSPASILSTDDAATEASSSSAIPMQAYANQRYDYTLEYPVGWFVDASDAEKDFSRRGGSTIGGDLLVSNLPNPGAYTPENPAPTALRVLTLVFYKVLPSVTLDEFVEQQAFDVDQRLEINVQSRKGLKLVTVGENEPTVVNTLIRLDDGIAVFNYGGDPLLSEDAELYEAIIRSFVVGGSQGSSSPRPAVKANL